MIVFLKKVRVKTVFSFFEPIVVEPLELCYLKSALNSMNVEAYVIDDLFNLNEASNAVPDVVVLTGYNVAENEIFREAKYYKSKYPHVQIVAGGVHVQGNSHVFHQENIDYVCHTQSLSTFKKLIYKIMTNDDTPTAGVDSNIHDGVKSFRVSHKETLKSREDVTPDRSFFTKHSHKLRYLEKKNVALIKGSTGCPYNCSYCYCKLLNNGNYIKTDYKQMIHEMESINADHFWVVDDVLFSNRADALEFIELTQEKKLNLKIIGYLRADFILREKDLLPMLRKAGIDEIIVGFEATDNRQLKGYKKATNALDYPEVIKLLKENHIDLTALFMVQPQYTIKDFKNLYNFIKNNNIEVYTVSILTPIKGTDDYENLKDKLTTHDPRKYDFLHLVLESRLPKWLFYMMFYSIHIKLLKSTRIWKSVIHNRR